MPARDFVKIKVKTADGATYTSLYQTSTKAIPLTNQAVTSSLWYWVTPAGDSTKGWNTGIADPDGTSLYKAGTYTVSAELDPLNHIKDNYKAPDGSDYTGKTVTALKTIAITEDIHIPPASVTNLHNTTYQQTTITWVWTDPSSSDYDHARVYLDGVCQTDVLKGVQTFTATGLIPSTAYTIGTRTVGTTGVINQMWVNEYCDDCTRFGNSGYQCAFHGSRTTFRIQEDFMED